jgi:hypothetical protein
VDINFAGVKDLFQELYQKMETYVLEDKSMSKDYRMHLSEIHEVIMFQLHQEFFFN